MKEMTMTSSQVDYIYITKKLYLLEKCKQNNVQQILNTECLYIFML